MRLRPILARPVPPAALLLALVPALRALEMSGDRPPAMPPVPPAETVFQAAECEREWTAAVRRASAPLAELGGRSRGLSGSYRLEGFSVAKGIRAEFYEEVREAAYNLRTEVSAAEAIGSDRSRIQLRGLRLASAFPGRGRTEAKNVEERFVITAERGTLELEQTGAEVFGGVRLEIFNGGAAEPGAVIACPRLRWRSWHDPILGAQVTTFHALPEKAGGEYPLVEVLLREAQPGAEAAVVRIRARGLIFERAVYDTPQPYPPEKPVGVASVARFQAVFHSEVKIEACGGSFAGVPAFQELATPRDARGTERTAPKSPAGKSGGEGDKPPKTKAPPERVWIQVSCAGGCLLDLAARPTQVEVVGKHREVLMGRRFVFLGGVRLLRTPFETFAGLLRRGSSDWRPEHTRLECERLYLQYGPQAPLGRPEYAEACGGVRAGGCFVPAPDQPRSLPPGWYALECQRAGLDRRTGAVWFEGREGRPVRFADALGELTAPAAQFSRAAQTLYLPAGGAKRLVLLPAGWAFLRRSEWQERHRGREAKVERDETTEITWTGACWRVLQAPVSAPPSVPPKVSGKKEVPTTELLHVDGEVRISQDGGKATLSAPELILTRDARTGRPLALESRGRTLLRNDDVFGRGEKLSVQWKYRADGKLAGQQALFEGDARHQALLWRGEEGIRAPRLSVDTEAGSFSAPDGAVLQVEIRPPKEEAKPAAAPAATPAPAPPAAATQTPALRFSGPLFMQCQGGLTYAEGLLVARGDCFAIQKEGPRVAAEELRLQFKETEAKKAETARLSGELPGLSGEVESVEYLGNVELVTANQALFCDRLKYDLKRERLLLERIKPADLVRIYFLQPEGGTRLLQVAGRLEYDGPSGLFTPGGHLKYRPFEGDAPLPLNAPDDAPPKPATGVPR